MAAKESFETEGWRISAVKKPILTSSEVDDFESALGFHLPEMVFGNSFVSFQHISTGAEIRFDCKDALFGCKHASTVQVASAKEWSARYCAFAGLLSSDDFAVE